MLNLDEMVLCERLQDVSSDDAEDWFSRTVERPVRNMVQLFHLEDTSLMDDLNSVYNEAREILEAEKISYSQGEDVIPIPNNDGSTILPGDAIHNNDVDANLKKSRRKKKTELENLEISMKGWS